MFIRPYEPRHLEAAASLWLDSWRSTGVRLEHEPTLAELTARLEAQAGAAWSVFLGWDDETLVGFLALDLADRCLSQLFIAPAHQRRGLGGELLDFTRAKLPDGWLRTPAATVGAQRFYQRHGLRLTERGRHPTAGYEVVVYRWP